MFKIHSVRNQSHHSFDPFNYTSTDFNESISQIFQHTVMKDKYILELSRFYGPIDAKFYASINPFWLKFMPPSPITYYIFGIVYLIIMIIGISGNILVIYMFIRCRSLRSTANTLVINLAISDFFMLAKMPIIIYNSFSQGPALGDFACRAYGLIGGLTGIASIATLTAIAIDRYFVIVYPLNPIVTTTKRRSRIMVIVIWTYSLAFSIPPALNIGLSKYVPEGFLTSCSFDYLDKSFEARIFMFVFFIFAWFIPFSVITFCYMNILRVVSTSKKIQSNKDKTKTEIRLAAIVLYVIALWFFAWSPYAVVALLGITGNEKYLTPMGSMLPAIFCKGAACIDPYVYAVTHPRFRMEFNRIFLGRDQLPKCQSSYTRCNSSNIRRRAAQSFYVQDKNMDEKSGDKKTPSERIKLNDDAVEARAVLLTRKSRKADIFKLPQNENGLRHSRRRAF